MMMRRETCAAILPYALWMVLLFVLPATAELYALRAALAALAVVAMLTLTRAPFLPWNLSFSREGFRSLLWGLAGGCLVCFLWIWPEQFEAYRTFHVLGWLGFGSAPVEGELSPYEPAVCGWLLTWIKLIGSAFVIAPVEEIFFRSFLYRWLQKSAWTTQPLRHFDVSAFLWMIALFALEHHTRLAAGAMAGAIYGFLAISRGMGAAVIAHVVTNLLLGLYVIQTQQWGFW